MKGEIYKDIDSFCNLDGFINKEGSVDEDETKSHKVGYTF